MLQRVEFSPSSLLRDEELHASVVRWVGQSVNFADVTALVREVNALYLARGHLTARAFVPAQRIADGVLRVQLVEARLAELVLPAQTRLSPDFIRALAQTDVGALIVVPALQQRLTRLHRNTENRIGLDFAAAQVDEPGMSVMRVLTEEPPAWTFRTALSNEGAESVGREQISVSSAWHNLLGRTDKLNLLAIGSKGSVSGNLQYSMPLGGPFLSAGTRLTFGVSHGKTQSVSPGFENVRFDGRSDSRSLALAQPIGQVGNWIYDTTLVFNQARSMTDIAAERFSDVRVDSVALSLGVSYQGEKRSLSSVMTLTEARSRGEGVPPRDTTLLLWQLNAQEAFSDVWWWQLRAAAQITDEQRIPASLQFAVGGPGSVRGFVSPAASGDQGASASLELHRRWGGPWDAFAFVDHGMATTREVFRTRLNSIGLGLNWTQGRWAVAATAAVPRFSASNSRAEGARFLLRVSADL